MFFQWEKDYGALRMTGSVHVVQQWNCQASGQMRQQALEENINDKASVQTARSAKIDPWKTMGILLDLKTQFVPRSKHF